MEERKHWMDNLRWGVILLVILFHVVCMFNSCDMPLGVGPGLPALDLLGYFLYPWFMLLMFLLAGISARSVLSAHSAGAFLRMRARRLLLPLLATLLLIAPLLCAFTWRTAGTSFGAMAEVLPVGVVVLIAALAGMGPQWFLAALFLYSALLLPLRRLDRGDRLWALCARVPRTALLLSGPVLWLGALVMPAPDRFVAYFFAFLLGYWVFSHENVLALLKKSRLPLLAAALVSFGVAVVPWWGRSFTDGGYLAHPVTALFAYFACLAALGGAQAWFDRPHAYWVQRGFALYLFHYLPMLVVAVYATVWGVPVLLKYGLTLLAAVAVPLALYGGLGKIPLLARAFGLRRG